MLTTETVFAHAIGDVNDLRPRTGRAGMTMTDWVALAVDLPLRLTV